MATGKLSFANICSYQEYQVLTVLHKLAPNEKNLRPDELEGFAYPPDFYLSEGLSELDLVGPTAVETKMTLSFSALKNFETYFETHSQNGYNLLVVFSEITLSKVPPTKTNNGKKMVFLSFADLKMIANARLKSEENYYLDNAKKADWKDLRNNIIEEAKNVVNQGNNVLFLGAGVSKSAGMPSWKELLKGLMSEVKMLKGDSLKAFTELDSHIYSECGDSNLIMARYLETAIQISNKKADFTQMIQKHLYSKEHTSDLLTDLALIIKFRKTDEVITYNFDDILEQELVNNGMKESVHFTPIARDAEVSDHNNLPIYHVHGIIPEHGDVTDKVVFSEDIYHDRYRNAFHWSNVEQLHALTRKHCFFIGLSMQDPNLRRLLDISRKMNATDKPSHYAFLPRTKQENYCLNDKSCKFVNTSQSLIDKKKQKDIYDINYTVLENIYRQLGVNVIWYESYDDIPGLIEQVFDIRKTQGESSEMLIQKSEQYIKRIKEIESKAPAFNPATLKLEDYINFLTYSQTYGDEYKSLVIECGDVLQELSNRIDYTVPDNLKILAKDSKKYDNLSGFGDLYEKWYDSIKQMN